MKLQNKILEEELIAKARYEKKFVTEAIDEFKILNLIKTHQLCFKKEYDDRLVNNIYFDSADLQCFQENLAGVSNRQKYRLRWYGNTNDVKSANFEIKTKKNELGWKEIFDIKFEKPLSEIPLQQLSKIIFQQLPEKQSQNFLTASMPILCNSYRRSYFTSHDKKIRLTLDKNLQVYNQQNQQILNGKLPENTPDILIMECKFDKEGADYAQKHLKKFPVRISKSSKYVFGTQAILNL